MNTAPSTSLFGRLAGLYCAVTRKTREGIPAGGWLPEQAVALDSALRHYTIDAAPCDRLAASA